MSTKQRDDFDLDDIPSSKGKRFALVTSEWNPKITNRLCEGAKNILLKSGVESNDIEEFYVPGSFELIHGCKIVAESLEFDAIISIGSIIRGETAHFEFVSQGVTHGISQLNSSGKTPIIFCVLTDDRIQQSIDRSGGKLGNKGEEAAVAAIKMSNF